MRPSKVKPKVYGSELTLLKRASIRGFDRQKEFNDSEADATASQIEQNTYDELGKMYLSIAKKMKDEHNERPAYLNLPEK